MTSPLYSCADCGDVMPDRIRELAKCKCGQSYVDQRRAYVRIGGHAVPVLTAVVQPIRDLSATDKED